MFVTPERLQRQTFRDGLIAGADVEPINLAVVDEAHCVSEWGHDFRAAYLNFGKTLRSTCEGRLGVPPLLALTGTASRAVLTDVLFQLGIVDDHENAIVRPASFDRAELSYDVLRCSADDSDATLRRVLAAMPGRFSAVAATFFEPTGDEDTFSAAITEVNGLLAAEIVTYEIRVITSLITLGPETYLRAVSDATEGSPSLLRGTAHPAAVSSRSWQRSRSTFARSFASHHSRLDRGVEA